MTGLWWGRVDLLKSRCQGKAVVELGRIEEETRFIYTAGTMNNAC